MIQKIKDLMRIKENIDEVNKSVIENKETILSLKENIDSFKKEFNEVKISQAAFLNSFKENLDLIKEMRENLEKEIYDFKLLKAQMQRKIMDKFEEELNKELTMQIGNLKTNITEYDKLKNHVSDIMSRTNKISSEIDKFTSISQSIRKEDFELTRFARQLLDMDQEKLALMRKIDTLERLIAKMRRAV